MNNKISIIVIISVYWIISTIINAGAIHSHDKAKHEFIRNDLRFCRENLGFALIISVWPFSTPLGFFATGFWYDGLNLNCEGAK